MVPKYTNGLCNPSASTIRRHKLLPVFDRTLDPDSYAGIVEGRTGRLLPMAATVRAPSPRKTESGEPMRRDISDELERIRAENERLRDLVIQLSRLVVQNAVTRK